MSRKQVIRQKPSVFTGKKRGKQPRICGSHIGIAEDSCLLGCYAVPLGLQLPTIRNVVAPSPSGSSSPKGSHFILSYLT